jgi:Family of unknown function (DUF6445)
MRQLGKILAIESPLCTFNPDPQIQIVALGDARPCLVVDNALLHPERLRQLAIENFDQFQQAPYNAYPGLQLGMPGYVSDPLDDFFMTYIRAALGGRRTVHMHSRLAMVTTPVAELQPRQVICHRDSQGLRDDHCMGASVLYLFEDETLGGTNFYAPKKTPAETDLFIHDSSTLSMEAFTAKYGVAQAYCDESNAYFERIASVPAKFNRMIFYDGSGFHSGNIQFPARMVADPKIGRLTLNGFFTCRKKAQ